MPNAINIPVEELEWEIEDLKENIDKPILVYCKAGHKSALACQMLEEEGFSNLYNLGQGVLGYKGTIE
ncbi:MAG: rhodanese-like domain-containing protein [Clostridium celatum]|nr:rhodanese-like domain-containing protein [Clostridium celatum]